MKLQITMLKIMERIANILHKDAMKYRIARFRIGGAQIGENVRAFSAVSSAEGYLIKVGDNVTLSSGVKFITHDNSAIKLYKDATDFVGSITIGNNCFVGMNTIFLPGVSICDNCIIGAGSVVTRSVTEPGSIVCGNPAKVVSNIEKLAEKNKEYCFNFRGLNYQEKKKVIMENQDRHIRK